MNQKIQKSKKEFTTEDFHKIVDNWFAEQLGKDWKEGSRKNAK